ncbi:MAG: flagellar basal body rod protein FlgB [Pseudomonadota bacterium]
MSIVNMNLLDMLKTRMQYDGERQKIIAQNIANVGIPGQKARDLAPLNFNNVLANEVSKTDLKVTSTGHLSGAKAHTKKFYDIKQKDSFDVTSTGNNIVVEEQMMKSAQNAADYQMATNLYKKIGNLFKAALGLQAS